MYDNTEHCKLRPKLDIYFGIKADSIFYLRVFFFNYILQTLPIVLLIFCLLYCVIL